MPNHALLDTTGSSAGSPSPPARRSGERVTAVFVFLLAAVLAVIYCLAVAFLKVVDRDKE